MSRSKTLFGKQGDVIDDPNFRLLLLANLAAPMGVGVVSPTLDTLTTVFDVSAAEIGLVMTAFTGPPILLIPLVGVAADRVGRKPILITGLLIFGLGGVAISFAESFRTLLALRLIQGLGYSSVLPIIITSIGDLYHEPRRSTAEGMRLATSGTFQTLIPILSGTLVAISWRYPYALHGLVLLVAVVLSIRLDEPTPRVHPPSQNSPDPGERPHPVGLLRRPAVVVTFVARGIPTIAWVVFLTYNSIVVVKVMGGTPQLSGVLIALGSVGYASAATQTGRLTARFSSTFYPLLGAYGFLAAGITAIGFGRSVPLAGAGAVVLGIGLGVGLSVSRSLITGLADDEFRGTLVGTGESFGRVAYTLTPIVSGLVLGLLQPVLGFDAALRLTLAGAGLVTVLLGAVCALLLRRNAM